RCADAASSRWWSWKRSCEVVPLVLEIGDGALVHGRDRLLEGGGGRGPGRDPEGVIEQRIGDVDVRAEGEGLHPVRVVRGALVEVGLMGKELRRRLERGLRVGQIR